MLARQPGSGTASHLTGRTPTLQVGGFEPDSLAVDAIEDPV